MLIGREKLNAVRAEIRAIDKVGLAKEVLEQKKAEAQELAEAVLDAEVRTGELLREIPKASADRGNQYTGGKSTTVSNSQKPKAEVLKEANIPQKQAERYQFLAEHKEEVEKAKADARRNDRIVTRSDVIDRVKPLNSRKEQINNAKKEHEAFKAQKVVDIQEAKIDKSNVQVIADDYETRLLTVVNQLFSLLLQLDNSIVEELPPLNRNNILGVLVEAQHHVHKIMRKIGGK